ncbi:MAG: ATP-binding protein [Candidatus Altiarchaeia archaeon]
MENVFREVLLEWKARPYPDLIDREDRPSLGEEILTLAGPRRSGKTSMLYLMAHAVDPGKESTAYIDFEDYRLSGMKRGDLSGLVEAVHELFRERDGRIDLFFDEIQNLPSWEAFLRTLHNSGKYRIAVSGSSSRMLSRDIATALRGRYVGRTVLPFSFPEFLRLRNSGLREPATAEERGKMLSLLSEYMHFGGFPAVLKKTDEADKKDLINTYYETIFYRDVVERHRIRNTLLLEAVAKTVIAGFGSCFSVSKTEKGLRSMGLETSKKTVSQYLKYLEEAYFVHGIEKFSPKIRDRVMQPKKVYPIDTGFFNLGSRLTPDYGRLMECLCATELLRCCLRDRKTEIFYWKDYQGAEVDYVVKEGLIITQLIQACYDPRNADTRERETKALISAGEELGCKNQTIITWDHEENLEGIKYVPLWKWLLTTP